MNEHTLTITDIHTGRVVETVRGARIPDMMRVRREYQGIEHDGRYKVERTTVRYDAVTYHPLPA